MLKSIRRIFRDLQANTSGNAMLMVALGMPVLIGASGLAVDTAQWYMWKREIQFAADQAALAGAWARSDDDSRSSYITRARQEFTANVSKTSSIITAPPNVSLANWNGGSQNSVVVTASVSKRLPFSSFLTNSATTVSTYAQASFTDGAAFTACLIATDDDDSGAITIGGNATLTAQCGIAALSKSPTSIVINGNPTVDPGWVVSAGGIDDWLNSHTDAEIHEYMTELSDPFANLTTPVPRPNAAQSYTCVAGSTTTIGDKRTKTDITYTYWQGSNTNNPSPITYTGTGYLANVTGTWGNWSLQVTLPNNSVNGVISADSSPVWTALSGSGQSKKWRKAVTRTYTEYANTKTTTTQTQATLNQGTYSGGFDVSCTTVLNPGIYVIDGGRVKITGQNQVTGPGVLFVLKNGAYIDFTGGSNITLTAATSAQLVNVGGLSSTQAQQFAGMLIYEDRASQGTNNRNTINGNSTTVLNGKIYLPKSDIRFNGTASVTSACLLIAAANITLEGNTNMSSFCPPGMTNTDEVSHGNATVKLVA